MRRVAVGSALAALAAAGLALTGATSAERALDGLALTVGALVMAALVRATRTAARPGGPSAYERALRSRRTRGLLLPGSLQKVEREVVLATTNAFDVHVRLRPRLRAIARHRLAARRGLSLDGGSPEVRELLGDELWELVRPERPSPGDRQAAGLSVPRQRALLDRLERL